MCEGEGDRKRKIYSSVCEREKENEISTHREVFACGEISNVSVVSHVRSFLKYLTSRRFCNFTNMISIFDADNLIFHAAVLSPRFSNMDFASCLSQVIHAQSMTKQDDDRQRHRQQHMHNNNKTIAATFAHTTM